jgi:DNA-binding HxlR family transcriptional regulator
MGKPKDNSRQSGCSVAYCLDLFGDKWSLLIVRDMMFLSKRYFGQFLESPERIASNILADRLKKLEDAGVLSKAADPASSSRLIYELTPKGLDLMPLIFEMLLWGSKHHASNNIPKELIRRLKRDKATVLADVRAHVKRKESYFGLNGWVP